VGACERTVVSCSIEGQSVTCVPGTPAPETCNGLDDDCNGLADDGLMPQLCGTGECQSVNPTCTSGQAVACPATQGSPEVCDGKDNDCNGTVDEGLLTNTSGDLRITNDVAASDFVYAGWNGTQFGLAWGDTRDGAGMKGEIYFAALDARGARTGGDVRITTTTGVSTHPALAWNGSRYGLVYSDDTPGNLELYFQLLEANGALVGGPTRLTTAAGSSDWADVVWTGTEFAVVFTDERVSVANADIYFVRVSASGQKLGAESKVTTDTAKQNYAILKWSGTEFGVSWTDFRRSGGREVYFRRLSATGAPVGSEVNVSDTPTDSAWSDLTWNGAAWALVWHEASSSTNTEVSLRQLSATGAPLAPTTTLSAAPGFSGYPSIDWNGFEYGVSWQDEREGKAAIYFAQVSAQGAKNGAEKKLSSGSGTSSFTTALWNGTTYGFAWRDDRDGPSGNTEIYFAYVGCPP
jgi:hypothetical protein